MRDLCPTHKLVLAPDGKCVLCRRPAKPLFTIHEEQETLISQVFTGLLGVGLVIGVISLVYASRLDQGYTGNRFQQRSQAVAVLPSQKARAQSDEAAQPDADEQAASESEQAAESAQAQDAQTAARSKPKAPAHASEPVKAKPRAPASALREVEVTMYATPWCEICDSARTFLRGRDVVLIEQNIDSDKAAAQKLAKLNPGMSVPTFEIGGRAYVGFNPWDIEDALQEAAQQRFAARKP